MSSFDIIIMGIKNLWRRKARTFLTTLGVIIGTASIISMISLGFGVRDNFNKNIMQTGSLNIIEVHNFGIMIDGQGSGSMNQKKSVVLSDSLIQKISRWSGVDAVTPLIESNIK